MCPVRSVTYVSGRSFQISSLRATKNEMNPWEVTRGSDLVPLVRIDSGESTAWKGRPCVIGPGRPSKGLRRKLFQRRRGCHRATGPWPVTLALERPASEVILQQANLPLVKAWSASAAVVRVIFLAPDALTSEEPRSVNSKAVSSSRLPLRTNSNDFSKGDLLSLEEGSTGSSFILRDLTADGQQVWQSQPISDVSKVIPSATGDAIVLQNIQSNAPTTISEFVAGQQMWSYAPSNSFQFSQNPAIRSDDTVFTVESDTQAGVGGTSQVVGLNGTNGSVLSHYQLPASTFTHAPYPTFQKEGSAGPLMIAPDGSIYVEFLSDDEVLTGTGSTQTDNDTYSLQLIQIDPSGNATMQLLHSGSWQKVGNGNPIGDMVYPAEVIPDGQGGVLAGWDLLILDGGAGVGSGAQLSHVTSAGAIVQYAVPFNGSGWCGGVGQCPLGGPVNSMVVGEHNTAFASSGDKLIAFDVNSGVQRWLQEMPSGEFVALVAATADGGVAAKETDQNGENIVRFDANGTPTQDVAPPPGTTGTGYYAGHKWVGVMDHRTRAVYTADEIDEAQTTWADSPVFRAEYTVSVSNFSQAGPNQTAIQNELQTLKTIIPANNTCSNWLHGAAVNDAPTYIDVLFGSQTNGVQAFGHGVFNPEDISAFTGANASVPPGILLTVNDQAAFFQPTDSLGNILWTGPRKYQGGKQRAQDAILIHEFAHGMAVPGFQPDLGKPWIGKENDKLVDDHCRSAIER
jgi:hypothetical protein